MNVVRLLKLLRLRTITKQSIFVEVHFFITLKFYDSPEIAREGRNPQTGAAIKIAAKKVAKFKAGADLDAKVN